MFSSFVLVVEKLVVFIFVSGNVIPWEGVSQPEPHNNIKVKYNGRKIERRNQDSEFPFAAAII